MKIIAHRGNIDGKKQEFENTPSYIDMAIFLGYDVEIDLRFINREYFLGHDEGQYKVNEQWLLDRKSYLWVHAKNLEVVSYLDNIGLNWFWHNADSMTITSKGYIWCYPGIYLPNGITVETEYKSNLPDFILGICSDECGKYKEYK